MRDPTQASRASKRRLAALTMLAVFASVVFVPPPAEPRARDMDGDGLSNRLEKKRSHTNPRRLDTDADGLTDGFEWRRSKTSPRRKDSDRDRASDGMELRLGTNPGKATDRGDLSAQPLPPCDRTAAGAPEARKAVQAVAPGQVVCLAPGGFGVLDLTNIRKSDFVTLRGAAGHASVVDGAVVDGSSFLAIEGFHFTGAVAANGQTETHHIAIRRNEIGPAQSGIVNTPSWDNAGHHHWVVERNFFRDISCDWPNGCPSIGPGYAIAARGNASHWTVRYNRFERILEDMIQSGQPDGWTVDHNWFGPGDFNRPAGYSGHPDLWQTLDSGTGMKFTNNVARDSNQSLGFIFGDTDTPDGFHNIEVTNNLFVRTVYGVGETCQFSPTNGFVFEENTLVSAKGCRWGAGGSTDWPDAENLSIKRNLLTGRSSLSCNDTAQANSCDAFDAGSSGNVSGSRNFVDTTWYVPVRRRANVGARLGPADFQGFPFAEPPGMRRDRPVPGIKPSRIRAYANAVLRRNTNGRVRSLGRACSGRGSPIVTCFLTWRIGPYKYRGDILFRHSLRDGRLAWSYSLKGTRDKLGCRRCQSKSVRW